MQGRQPSPYNAALSPYRKEHVQLDSASLARLAFEAMGEKQASDVVILDIRPVAPITDYFVVGTADSARQIHAVVGAVLDRAREQGGVRPNHVEGDVASGWVLVDFADVVVHVFDPARRAYYALERMWDGAPLVARMP